MLAPPSAETGQPAEQAVVPSGGALVATATRIAGGADGPSRRLPLPLPLRLIGQPRHSLRMVSFIAVVLMPVAIVAAYYFAVAADQYVAEFRFTLSTVEPPRLDPLSLLAGNAAPSPVAVESQILVQYIASRAMVDEADAALDLRRLFSPPQADWWARPPQPATHRRAGALLEGPGRSVLRPGQRHRRGTGARLRSSRCAALGANRSSRPANG